MSDLFNLTQEIDKPASNVFDEQNLTQEPAVTSDLLGAPPKVETAQAPVDPFGPQQSEAAPAEAPAAPAEPAAPRTWREIADEAWANIEKTAAPSKGLGYGDSDIRKIAEIAATAFSASSGAPIDSERFYNGYINGTLSPEEKEYMDSAISRAGINMGAGANERKTLYAQGPDGANKLIGTYYIDENGQVHRELDLSNELAMLDEAAAKGQSLPSFEEWAAQNGVDVKSYDEAGLAELIAQLQAGGDIEGANDYAAQQQGFASAAEMEAYKAQQRGQLDQGIAGQQGFTQAENEAWSTLKRMNRNEAVRLMQMNLDTVASSGQSFANYMMKSDMAIEKIQSADLQASLTRANDEFARKTAEYSALAGRNDTMLKAGQISMEQYFKQDQEAKSAALQGYATQISGAIADNQMSLNRYQQDIATIELSIQNTYAAVQASLGVTAAGIQIADAAFKQDLADYMVTLQEQQLALQERAIAAQESANAWAGISTMFGALSKVFGLLPGFGGASAAATVTGG